MIEGGFEGLKLKLASLRVGDARRMIWGAIFILG